MENEDDNDSLPKVPRLKDPSHFIKWRRKMEENLLQNDPTLKGLSENPRGRQSYDVVVGWTNRGAKSMEALFFALVTLLLHKHENL